MSGEPEYTLRPIGRVRNQVKEWVDVVWEDLESEVVLDPRWAEGLAGLEGFSHVWVIGWLDRLTEEERGGRCRVHPQGRQDLPTVGLFATRSPRRPNPIAITAVRLLGIDGTVLRVKGLDMLDGTPVLDVKPYLAQGDRIAGTRAPRWIHRLWCKRQTSPISLPLPSPTGEGRGVVAKTLPGNGAAG